MLLKLFLIITISLNLYSYERIIALSPSINEIIYALGDGDKIVGNTTFCRYPKDALSKAKVGGFFSPSLEKILSLKPDIVIMQRSSLRLSKKLEKLGIKTKVIKTKTLEDIRNTISGIGLILNKNKEALTILDDITNRLNETKNIVKDKKILMVIGHNLSLEKRIFVAGQNLYFDDIINYSQNINAFQSPRVGQPILNMENIIATNPDIVILLAPFTKDKGLTKEDLIKPWLTLPIAARKAKSIYVIDKHYAGIASHRLRLFLEDYKNILINYKKRELDD